MHRALPSIDILQYLPNILPVFKLQDTTIYSMGCIHSQAVVKLDLNPPPSSHPTDGTQRMENTSDIGVSATNANNQELEEDQKGGKGGQVNPNQKVVLGDIEVECSPEHASELDGLMLAIFGLEGEECAALKKLSRTTWSWPGVITLMSNMNQLIFIAQSKDGKELGSISLNNDELCAFRAVQDDIEDEREFFTGEAGPSLKLTFTLNLFKVDDRTATYSSEEIEQMVKDTAKNSASFPNVLEKLANEGPEYLHLFGFYFTHRFEETGNIDDINCAINAYERAMECTTPDDLSHAIYVHATGTGYLSRFILSGNIPDIEQALSFLGLSASQSREDDVALPERLSRLGIAYRVRFKATGDLVDIENAISSQQRGVQLTQANHPDLAARLAALGNSFKARFDRKGDLVDINSAIVNTERAIGMSTERHDDMSIWLNNLGSFYQMRFNRTGIINDFNDGIKYQKRSIDIAPKGHPKMAAWLNNLGCSYQSCFGRTKDTADIEMAIEVQTRAVEIAGDGYMLKPLFLRNLGNSYHTRFRATENSVDIDIAIERHQQAVVLTPEGHADLPSRLGSLGTSFRSRFRHSGDKADVLNAITSFREAATGPTGRPSTRLSAACEWGLLCQLYDPSQSLEAFRMVIELLSQVAGLEQTIQKRHRSLIDISDLTMMAAAMAIDQGELGTAVEWLEQGRCLVWSQINQLRTPVESLQLQDPELAQRFLSVARALEDSGSRQEVEYFDVGGTDDMSHLIAAQDEIHVHVGLAKEYHTLLAQIRGIPGFENFLQPPNISDLLSKLPKDSVVVTFVLHQDRCDALVLKKGLLSPIHVPLRKITPRRVLDMRNELHLVLRSRGLRMREVNPEGERSRSTIRVSRRGEEITISNILEELWVKVVESVVRSLDAEIPLKPKKRLRIWWCPTGSLAFLPLHAAGIYKKGFNVLDFFVSSYTPTISAFLNNLEKSQASRDTKDMHPTAPVVPTSLLLISQPNTPGLSPIPGTTEETQEIQKLINATVSTGPVIYPLLLEGGEATVARVKDELKSHTWVHFACHAIQDVDSLKSGLHLHDRRLELLEIMKQRTMLQTTVPTPEWAFAFLSACQTGTGDEKLSDEVVHIAAGMLAVGYSGVVATMWSIKDAYGKGVAVSFYKHLLLSTRDDTDLKVGVIGGAAWALDQAVSDIRKILGDNEEGLLTWVPYVHYGV